MRAEALVVVGDDRVLGVPRCSHRLGARAEMASHEPQSVAEAFAA